MRHQVAGKKLGRTSAHRKAMFRNMINALILRDRIETTLPKAKELKRWADKMITLAKKNTVSSRRQAMKILRDHTALQKLFTTLVDRYKDRAGGYTRVLKLGFRHGDKAAMAVIEYLTAEAKKVLPSEKPAKGAARKKVSKKETVKSASAKKSVTKKGSQKKKETKKTTPKKKAK